MTAEVLHQRGPADVLVTRRQRVLGLLAAVGTGVFLAVQSQVNGVLGGKLHDAIGAATISFASGLLVLAVMTAIIPAGRNGIVRIVRSVRSETGLRLWHCLGGLSGAFMVFSQGVSAAAMGVALFMVAVVAGQVTSGLIVDRLGVGPGGIRPITVTRVIGAVLAIAAVLVSVFDQLEGMSTAWLAVLPALAGFAVAWQQAITGHVRKVAESAVSAAFVNFLVGTAALILVFGISAAIRGLPGELPGEWWLYIGGVTGIIVIGGAAILVRITGVLLLGMGMIAGQLLGALVIDLVVPSASSAIHLTTLFGVGLALLAAGVAALPRRR